MLAIHCIEIVFHSGNNRRSMQRNERDAKSILQAFAGKTKKDNHVSQWCVRRTISAGGCFVLILIFDSHYQTDYYEEKIHPIFRFIDFLQIYLSSAYMKLLRFSEV